MEGLFILDNKGGKFYSTTGFIGGRQSDIDSKSVRKIDIDPGEEIVISAEFPMIGEGATTFKFVSPQLTGWQSQWSWPGIKLKSFNIRGNKPAYNLEKE
jgi:hypothetical protein